MSTNKTGAHPEASTVHAVGGTVSSADATAAAALAAVHERTASGSSLLPTLPPATVTSSTTASDAPAVPYAATPPPSSTATAAAASSNTPRSTPPPPPPSAAAAAATAASTGPSPTDTGKDKATDPTSEKQDHPHHVIFVVHGMGRQLEEFGNYERNVGHLVENTRLVLQNQFFEHRTDVHIIPIEWHAKLHSMVDQRMSLASLKTVPKVRLVMNDYFADILYYFNSHYGGEITKFIVDELNEAYTTFIAKHPNFNGKIAIYALSLGGVAMYDILTCQDDIEDEDEEQSSEEEAEAEASSSATTVNSPPQPLTQAQIESKRLRKENSYKYRAIMHKLKFRPHYLFTVGSPVGAVMYTTSQSLLPSLSLPSLPSLSNLPIPESISSFWEQKVPAIPRSIPSFRTISQVAQTLKAASWRSSNRNAGDSNNNTTTAGGNSMLKKDQDASSDGDEAVEGESSMTSNGSLETHPHDRVPTEEDDKEIMMSSDADATAGEAIVAAAAFAYFDQDPSNRAPRSSSSSSSSGTTVASGMGDNVGRPRPGRRPSLGPRKISNRMDLDPSSSPTTDDDQAVSKKLKATVEDAVRENEEDEMADSTTTATTAASSSSSTTRKGDDRPAPKLDEVLDRHQSKEKARASACPSPVVSPTSTATATAGTTTGGASISSTRKNRERTYPYPLLVQGRPTAVPYRIDHTLQETKVDQYTNEYLLGMRSHFRYWANRDIAYHILKHLLHEPGKKPLDDEQKLPDGPVDLQLHMPAPVRTPRGVREAAEAKAKQAAAAAAAASAQQHESVSGGKGSTSTATTTKEQRRQSASHSSTLNMRRQEHDEEDFMLGRGPSMHGYRFNDLDISMAANVDDSSSSGGGASRRRPSTTLFQNSPFSNSSGATSILSAVGSGSEASTKGQGTTSTSTTTTTATTTTTVMTTAPADMPAPPPPAALSFDEGVGHVQDLRRPARSHRRLSRTTGEQ
ncbi:hypothetical protein BGZ73_006409 [Actinomortierella ambigua]|nr:hypothetical protein BGZ73_006409 [Actinomortierella ambigua]